MREEKRKKEGGNRGGEQSKLNCHQEHGCRQVASKHTAFGKIREAICLEG